MSRSKWKGEFIDFKKTQSKQFKLTKIVSRNSKIVPNFVNQTFKISNGKENLELLVTKEMLNHSFGEFIFTRKKFFFKKKKLKK